MICPKRRIPLRLKIFRSHDCNGHTVVIRHYHRCTAAIPPSSEGHDTANGTHRANGNHHVNGNHRSFIAGGPFVAKQRFKTMKLLLILLMTLVLLLLLAACQKPSAVKPIHLPLDGNDVRHPPAFIFGIIYPLVHPYYEIVTEKAEQAAMKAGGRLIIKAPDEANPEQQIRMIEDMVRQGVDGIAISPIDSEVLTPYINQAIEAGIPVICFESDAAGSNRLVYIGGDHERSGALMGEALTRIMGDEGMVLVEYGMPSMTSQKKRLHGFIDYTRDHTNLQVLEVRSHEGRQDQALLELEQMIDAHPHFDAFISLDYVSGASSIIAWKAMGLNRYALTFGMMPAIEEAIINGQISLAVSQNEVVWGEYIVNTLRDLMRNFTVPEVITMQDKIIDLTTFTEKKTSES